MRILMVHLGRFIGAKAGTERVFCNMANALSDKGHHVTAIYMENKLGDPPFEIVGNVNLINAGLNFNRKLPLLRKLRRIFIFNDKKRHKYDASFLDIKIGNRLKSFINQARADIIISYSANTTRVIKKVVCPNCPVITMFHFNPEHILEKCFADTLRTLEESECIQVLDEEYIEITGRFINHNGIVYIPNVVYPPKILTDDTVKESLIIHIGRVNKTQKRQHLLIEAFALIANEFLDWNIEFWGEYRDVRYFEYCKMLTRKYGIENRVKFCGVTDDVGKQLMRASIFAFPSAFEGFPLALTEAMAAGLPSIGYKSCPSVKKLIRDGKNGILCDDGIEPLARALYELCMDKAKRNRYGKQASIDMGKYSPENIWGSWEKLIEKTVEEYRQKKSM